MINFTYRNYFTGPMELEDPTQEENFLFNNLQFMYLFNYNTFKASVLFVPPILLIGYYFQLQAMADLMYDPYSG